MNGQTDIRSTDRHQFQWMDGRRLDWLLTNLVKSIWKCNEMHFQMHIEMSDIHYGDVDDVDVDVDNEVMQVQISMNFYG